MLDGLLLLPAFALVALILHGTAREIVVLVLVAAYDIVGVARWGQTVGKRIVGTRVVSFSSQPLRPGQAVVRYLTYGGPALVFTAVGLRIGAEAWTVIVLLPVLRPPLHRGIHDLAARTIVVPTSS